MSAAPKTFAVEVPNVGAFVFRRRTLRDEIRIGAAQERLTEGLQECSDWFRNLTYMLAALEALTVTAPAGWDPLEMDALDSATFAQVASVYAGLSAAEARFRPGGSPDAPSASAGAGALGTVPVPATLPPD